MKSIKGWTSKVEIDIIASTAWQLFCGLIHKVLLIHGTRNFPEEILFKERKLIFG